jgi:hypothetical protein
MAMLGPGIRNLWRFLDRHREQSAAAMLFVTVVATTFAYGATPRWLNSADFLTPKLVVCCIGLGIVLVLIPWTLWARSAHRGVVLGCAGLAVTFLVGSWWWTDPIPYDARVWSAMAAAPCLLATAIVTTLSLRCARAAALAVCCSAAVLSLLVLIEDAGARLSGVDRWMLADFPRGTLPHRNVAGHFLMGGLIILLARGLVPTAPLRRWLPWMLASGWCSVGLLATRSRTAFAASCLGALVLLVQTRGQWRVQLPRLTVFAVVMCSSACFLVSCESRRERMVVVAPAKRIGKKAAPISRRVISIAPPGSVPPLVDRLLTPLREQRADASWAARIRIWSFAVHLLRERPLGVGPGRFGAASTDDPRRRPVAAHAHNIWLQVSTEFGLVTGVSFLVASLFLFAHCLRLAWRPVSLIDGSMTATAIAGVIAFCAAGMLDNAALTWGCNLELGVFLGWILRTHRRKRDLAAVDGAVGPVSLAQAATSPR